MPVARFPLPQERNFWRKFFRRRIPHPSPAPFSSRCPPFDQSRLSFLSGRRPTAQSGRVLVAWQPRREDAGWAGPLLPRVRAPVWVPRGEAGSRAGVRPRAMAHAPRVHSGGDARALGPRRSRAGARASRGRDCPAPLPTGTQVVVRVPSTSTERLPVPGTW